MSNLRVNNIQPFSTAQVTINGMGIYLPKVTTAQRNAIASPQDGLVVYNTDSHAFEHWNSSTNAWESVDGIQSLNGLLAKNQLFAVGTNGLTPNWVSTGSTHTLNIPMAQADDVTAGLLSYDDWVLFAEASTMGLIEGGGLHTPSGLTVTLNTGFGYLEKEPEIFFRFDWPTQTLTLPANQESYIYVNDAGAVVYSPVYPDTRYVILLGRVVTDASNVIFIDNSPLDAEHSINNLEDFHRQALGAVYAEGSTVVEVGTRGLQVTPGIYFLSGNKFTPSGANPISWKAFHKDGTGGFTYSSQSTVDNGFYDNGSGTLAPLSLLNYAKHSLYVVGDGAEETYMLVYSQAQYSALTLAQQGNIPAAPTYFTDAVALIASIIVKQGTSTIVEIRDERPVIGFKATGVAASTFHSGLLGLTTGDDHPQYWRNDGTHVATGNFNLGSNNINNVSTVNGVVPQTHATRHNPGGADAVATAAPITQGPDVANTEGVAASVARSDHQHNIPTAAAVGLNSTSTNTQGAASTFSRSNHTHAIASGTPSTQNPDQANAAGAATGFAKADHVHNIPTAVAVTIGGNSTNTQGSSTSFARADHTHDINTGTATQQTPDQTSAEGTSDNLARADHVHNIPTAVPVNIGTANAQGAAGTFAKSDHVHQGIHSLKANSTGTQRFGDIVAQQGNGLLITDDGAGNITFETNGGPNELLVTAGTGLSANFTAGKVRFEGIFAQVAAGSVALTANATNVIYVDVDNVVKSTVAATAPAGTIPMAHCVTNATVVTSTVDRRVFLQQSRVAGTPVNVGSANAAGTSNNYARADHVHQAIHSVKAGLAGTQRFGDVALVAGGGITVVDDGAGNFTITAAGQNAVGNKGDIQFRGTNTGQFGYNAAGHFNWDDTKETLIIGATGSNLSNNPLDVGGLLNDFVQTNIQNKSNGTGASSDMVATTDNGSDNTGYIDMGINSSTYNQAAYNIGAAGDGYVYVSGGNIAIGTDTAAKNVLFHTAGTTSANERARITNTGIIVSGTSAVPADNGVDVIQAPPGASISFQMKEIFDDLDFGLLGATANPHGFLEASINGGACTIETAATGGDYIGRIDVATGSTNNATGKGVLDIWGGQSKMRIGSKRVIFEQRIQVPALSTNATAYILYLGLVNAVAAGLPTAGVFFTYTHSVNGGNWQAITRTASTSTTISSSVPVAPATWTLLRAEINAAGTSVAFYVDNVLIGTSTTNIPTAQNLRPVFEIDKSSSSNTSRILSCDSLLVKMFR